MKDILLALIAASLPVLGAWLRSRLKQQDQALQQIHILVNGNTTELLQQIKTLTQAIADASPMDLVKAQAALVADGAVERKEAAIESLNAYPVPTEPDKSKAS